MGKVSVKESRRRRRRRSMRSLICKFKWTSESRRRSMYLEKRWVESPRLKKDPNRFKKKKHVSEFNCDLAYAELTRKIYGKMTSIVEKEKHVSGLQIQVDASSEKKHSRIEKEKHVSGLQIQLDASSEKMPSIVEKEKHVSRVQKGMDGSERQTCKVTDSNILDVEVHFRLNTTISSCDLAYAELALKSYEKENADVHKIIEILFANRTSVLVPGYEDLSEWCHVGFIAKPRNSTGSSPKNFFAEIRLDCTSGTHDVVKCVTFNPSGAGLTHGCGFCKETPLYLHPAGDYKAGLPDSTYPCILSPEYAAALASYGFDKFCYSSCW